MSKRGKTRKPISEKTKLLLDSLSRRTGVRNVARRILIVCEDDKSSPNYFRAIIQKYRLSAAAVVVGSGHQTQPIQVVDLAIERRERAKESTQETPFDETWCVIDGEYGKKIANARARANAKNIKLAISTPCFEYWVLLHFKQTSNAGPDCKAVMRSLFEHIPDYEKGKCDFENVVQHVKDASQYAHLCRKQGLAAHPHPEDQNPCSELFKLIKSLNL